MPVADFSLAGKVAIVTGGSRGIGRAISIALAEAGADVVVAARKAESLEETVAEIVKAGRRALAVPTNVRETEALRSLVAETKRQFGRLDILVNNAATNPVFGPIAKLEERTWDTIMNTNVKSAWLLSTFAREVMLENGGGSIVNVSSTGGLRASMGLGCYSVSKAALIMLTQVLAKEWGPEGIRVNCVAPGLIKTEFSRALWENEQILQTTLSQSPLRRIGLAEEVAGAVVYFASPASSYTNGQTLVIDGGGLA